MNRECTFRVFLYFVLFYRDADHVRQIKRMTRWHTVDKHNNNIIEYIIIITIIIVYGALNEARNRTHVNLMDIIKLMSSPSIIITDIETEPRLHVV